MKVFVSTLGGLLLVALIAAAIIASIFWSRLPDILATHLSNQLKVAVSIDRLKASWNTIDIFKVRIANLPKSLLSNAFTCQQISLHSPLSHYVQERVIIDEIDLNTVYLGLEFDSASGTNGNWTALMNNMQVSTATSSSRSLLIRKVVLTDIDVDVVYRQNGSKVTRLPRIPRMELTNITSEGGIPGEQIMNSVLGEMLKQVFLKQNLKNMFQELLQQPQNPVRNYLSPFQKMFNFQQKNNPTLYASNKSCPR
jgi:hypothetical protein